MSIRAIKDMLRSIRIKFMSIRIKRDSPSPYHKKHLGWAFKLTLLLVLSFIVLFSAIFIMKALQYEKSSSNKGPFGGRLIIDAPGCVITGPDGKSLKDKFVPGQSKVLIPEGTTFNSYCFPDSGWATHR
ncbi:hypothetical protein [Pseudomonas syringae pv. coryli]|uniref:hypothetical protein n=1 Tax=Pseudomonas syringae pv. coryli TaxID=317659 RepID=UPI003D28D86E